VNLAVPVEFIGGVSSDHSGFGLGRLLDVDEVRERIRALHEGRSDDAPEAIRTRLVVYQKDTAPLVAHYAQRGIVHRVPGVGEVDAIAEEIKRVLGR